MVGLKNRLLGGLLVVSIGTIVKATVPIDTISNSIVSTKYVSKKSDIALLSKLNRRIELEDYKLDTDIDDCNALQQAINNNPGNTIYLPPRVLEMGTGTSACNIIIKNAVTIKGSGYSDTASAGTVLHIPNNKSSLFDVSTDKARGTIFELFSVKQDNSTNFNANWQPKEYPAVFNVHDTYGGITIRDIFAVPVYDFVKVRNSGRINVEMKGQVFHRFIDADQQYDTDHYKAHLWPYWSSNTYVLNWTQKNLDALYLARDDGPVVDIFCYACHAGARLVKSDTGITVEMNGAIRVDGSAYGLLIESNAATANLQLLTSQNEIQPQGTGKPVTGGRAIKITGNNNIINASILRSDRNDTGVIEFTKQSGANIVNIGNMLTTFANQDNNHSELVLNEGVANTVQLATPPIILNSNNAGCGASCVVAMGQNNVANQANSLRGFASIAGNAPTLSSIGSDTNIDLNLAPKGTGKVNIHGSNPTISTNQDWLNLDGGKKGLTIGNNGTARVMVNSSQMWPLNGGTYPLGLSTNPWANVYSNTYSFNKMFASAATPTILSGFGTSPSVTVANGTVAFRVNVGSGGTASSGVIGLPNATNGWNCFAQDVTTTANVWQTKQTANTTNSVTLTNYNNGTATAWTANDVLAVSCFAY